MNLKVKDLKNVITREQQDKWYDKFVRRACYMGNGVYSLPGTNVYSSDTRELFLMFVAIQEGIEFETE